MDSLINIISQINDTVNSLVWGVPMIILIISTGVYFSIRTKFFQIFHFKMICKNTVCKIFGKNNSRECNDKKAISQFQALSTALAATIGTGSIAGVATAITIGGAGAVFWMWISALFGMMTVYAENVLGIYFRHKNKKGEWAGGAMYYIEKGLGAKWLAIMFSIFCIGASFGIGNMAQSNSIADALNTSFNIDVKATGIITSILVGLVIIGGIKRIGKFAEAIIPFISVIFIIFSIVVLLINIENIPTVISDIFKSAFGVTAVGGGISGALVKKAVSMGVKRGVFSNEAGMGSSVMAHCASDVKEPAVQGMWGIFEVFVDTMVVCTMTALVILSTKVMDFSSADGSALIIKAFEKDLGKAGSIFITFSIVIFAFATLIGWSYFGEKAIEYLFTSKSILVYKVIFTVIAYIGCILKLKLVWDISDTLNGLMAIPNLIALWLLSGTVIKITQNYLIRQRKNVKYKPQPMLSYSQRFNGK